MTDWRSREADLISAATEASRRAYAPYSQFHVGAAVLTRSGLVFSGCNVENATFGATVCAERNAVAAAIGAGERAIVACVVVTAEETPTPPCGICRQVLYEFGPDCEVLAVTESGARRVFALGELLPAAFGPSSLHGAAKGAQG